MAVTLSITDGTTTVALSSADASWQLLSLWEPVVATPTGDGSIPGYVTDVLPVIITPNSSPTYDNNLAAELQDLHALQKQAAEYWADENQVTPVWFQRKLNTETGTAQTLVRSIDFDVDVQRGSWIDACPAIADGRLGNIAITHHPTWETTSAVAASGATSVSVLGGSFDYTDVVGDFPARPYYIRYYGGDAGAVFQYAWLGFRSDARCGTATQGAASFTALWECEAGTPVDVSDVTEGDVVGASPTGGGGAANATTIDFTDNADWHTVRFTVALDQIEGTAADIPAYFGTFIVLLRAKVDAGTAQVKMEQRAGPLTGVFGPIVDISATAWTIYNLGTVTFPMRDRKAIPIALLAAAVDDNESIGLWARQKTGTPTLDCDCFILIPADEYFVLIGNVSITTDIEAYVGVSPTDNWHGLSLDVSTTPDQIQDICPVSISGAGIPVGDGRAFICTANASLAAPPYNDDIDMQVSTYPRWLSLRGAE